MRSQRLVKRIGKILPFLLPFHFRRLLNFLLKTPGSLWCFQGRQSLRRQITILCMRYDAHFPNRGAIILSAIADVKPVVPAEDAKPEYYPLKVLFADRKCYYTAKADRCEFCQKMGYECGPKLSKAEFITLRNAFPSPRPRISDLIREAERAFPSLEPNEIFRLVSQKLNEANTPQKYSSIARELEREFPHMEAAEIHRLVAQKIGKTNWHRQS